MGCTAFECTRRSVASYSSNLSSFSAARSGCRAWCLVAGRRLAACFGCDCLQRRRPIHGKFSAQEGVYLSHCVAHYVRRPSALVPLLCSGSGQKPQTDEPCCWEPLVHSICDKSCQVDRDCRVLLHLRPCACPQKWQLQDICQLKKGHGFHEAVGEELGCQAAPVMQE